MPQLDALRFLAFFLVFLHHGLSPEIYAARWTSTAFQAVSFLRDTCGFGLCLFFFLSSYLITSLLVLEKDATGDVNLRNFYVRRVLRIWPLYFIYIGAIALAGVRLQSWHISLARLTAMSLLAGNWFSLFAGMGNSAIAALWSISVEEQFYAVWPTAFRLSGRRKFIVISALVGAGSLLSTYLLARGATNSLQLWLNTFPESVFFASGALVAMLSSSERKKSIVFSGASVVAGFLFWFAAEAIGHVTDRTVQVNAPRITLAYLLIACGCFALLEGFLRFPAGLIPSPLIYLGKISYGLYVFHGFVNHIYPHLIGARLDHIVFGNLLVTFPMTVGIAALSYQFLEKPFLLLKRRFESVRTRAA